MFSANQLDQLAHIGIFRPSGINDSQRVDLSRESIPFTAVDSSHAFEIDDAVRVLKLRRGGGFMVQAAIADGSQLSESPTLIGQAIDEGENQYTSTRVKKSILPTTVVRELELRHEINRALVISQTFDSDGDSNGDVEIFPAIVTTVQANLHDFARDCLSATARRTEDSPITHFHTVHGDATGRRGRRIGKDSTSYEMIMFSQSVVSRLMVLSNLAITAWAEERGLPILYRKYEKSAEAEEAIDSPPARASYSAIPLSHDGFTSSDGQSVHYTHGTSPLRRAADLVNHLQIGRLLADADNLYSFADLKKISGRIN